MPQANQLVRHIVTVKLSNGSAVTGLTQSSFTIALRRWNGSALVAASEPVTLAELSAGDYQVTYTPTNVAPYVLSVVPTNPANLANPDDAFQDDVQSGSSSGGPYLTTRSSFRAANVLPVSGAGTAGEDAAIDALLPMVTDQIQRECGRDESRPRVFQLGTVTELLTPRSRSFSCLWVDRPPIVSITSLYLSFDIPRIYDSTTLLVEGTDFFVDPSRKFIELVTSRLVSGSVAKVGQLTYVGGFSSIPGDLEDAAQMLLATKLQKRTGKFYPLASVQQADGRLEGIRFDDITPNIAAILEGYRLRNVG